MSVLMKGRTLADGTPPMSQNQLARETSPYLLQHKDNPVYWRPWSEDALAEARRQDKPILLSIGYAACHWCHVMAHESFENEEIAKVMNDQFINIKVDREERPDIDAIYQSALALMGQQGGWPLTMFLTPNGEPFWGGTYFPPTARYGRPAFPTVLHSIAETYRRERDKVQKNVAALRDGLSKLAEPQAGEGLTAHVLDEAAVTALRQIDPLWGGTAGAPKFPQPMLFRFLWRAYKRTRSPLYRDAVTLTLDHLCQGGIYDHLGGGFARYSTDAEWLVPHFEKMLYDNALLVDLMSEVWASTRSSLYQARVRKTVDWALREMRVDPSSSDGTFAFASALDADSEGVEGKYYVWTEAEIDSVLGPDSALFKQAYHVTPGGNWEECTILRRSGESSLGPEALETMLTKGRAKLLAARSRRIPPGRDDKVLADWNGLMIAALANASAVLDEPSWRAAAETVFRFVAARMEIDGRLRHVWRAGVARHPAIIDDYANMARAALALFEVTGNEVYLTRAQTWVETADRHHWDTSAGGYFLSADDTRDVISRAKTIVDNAVPSGNGTMVEVLARLFCLTGNDAYRRRAEDIARFFSGKNPQYLLGIPGLLTAYELLQQPVQIVVIGPPDDPGTLSLRRAAFASGAPRKIVMLTPPGRALPDGHPAEGKSLVEGKPTAFVCVGATCGLPITDPIALSDRLSSV